MSVLIRWLEPLVFPVAAGLLMLLFDWRLLLKYSAASGFAGYLVAISSTVFWGVWVGIGLMLILAWGFGFRTLRGGK